MTRQGAGLVHQVFHGTGGHNLTAVNTGVGTHVHNVVGGPDGVLVVLHHHQGVAQVPKPFQRFQQLVVVPLVETDGGFIENVKHAHKTGANLGSQPDALAFAAGQGSGAAAQGQILEAHRMKKFQPGADFPENLLGNDGCAALQLEIPHKSQPLHNGQFAEVGNAHTAYGDSSGDFAETVTAAVWAGPVSHALLQLLADVVRLGLLIAALHIVQHALKGLLQNTVAVAPLIVERQLFLAGAVENDLLGLVRQLGKGRIQIKVVLLGHGLEIHPSNGIVFHIAPAGHLNAAVQQGQVRIGNDQLRVRHQLKAQARAGGAGAVGVVKGEHPGRQLRHRHAAGFTGVVEGIQGVAVVRQVVDQNDAAGVRDGGFDGIGQTAFQPLFHNQTVNDHFNVVLFILFQGNLFGQVVEVAVYPDTGETAFAGVLKHLLVLTLFAPDHRGENLKAGALRQPQNLVHNLVDGLFFDFPAALGAVGRTGSGPQQTQIVVNLRDGAHGGAGVLGGGLLVDGNGGAQAVDAVHIGLVHLSQEHTGVGGQALHISPLALGVDGVKGQRRFAGAGQAREDHQLIPRQRHIHIFQVVFPGAPDGDLISHGVKLLAVLLHCFGIVLYQKSNSLTMTKTKQMFA